MTSPLLKFILPLYFAFGLISMANAQDKDGPSPPQNTLSYSVQGSLGLSMANVTHVEGKEWTHTFGTSIAGSATINYCHADRISILGGLGISMNSYGFNAANSEYKVYYYLLTPQVGLQYLFNKKYSQKFLSETQPYFQVIAGYQRGDNDSLSHSESSFLARSWMTDKNVWYIQPEIGFRFYRNGRDKGGSEISLIYRSGSEEIMRGELKGDDYQTNYTTRGNYFAVSYRKFFPVDVNPTKKTPKEPKPEREKPEPKDEFVNRPTKVLKTIELKNSNIKLYVYDSGAKVDGDIISMTLNGDYILEKYKLKKGRKLIEVTLQDGDNEIIMHAHNEGKIPPNTAAIFIIDGNKKHHLVINSDLETSGVLKLIYKK
jgi:hypothetical protein